MRIIKDCCEIETQCPYCGSTFAYHQRDVMHERRYAGTHDFLGYETDRYLVCPCCDKRISILSKYIIKNEEQPNG